MFGICLQFGFGTTSKAVKTDFAFTKTGRDSALDLAGGCAHVKLSKNSYYLVDNMYRLILSSVGNGEQEKSGGSA